MKKKKILIIVCSILIILVLGLSLFFFFKKNEDEKISYNQQIKEYLLDTKESETSIWALLENGYIADEKEDKCNIYKEYNGQIKFVETNCDKALEIARKPIMLIVTNNDFEIDKWNNIGTTLSIKLKNGGNSYYKEEDIQSINWYSVKDEFKSKKDSLVIEEKEYQTSIDVSVDFKDLTLTTTFDVLIDKSVPILEEYNLDELDVIYKDNVEMAQVYYYLSEDNNVPKKEDMHDNISYEDYACGKEYYVWTYGKDIAGNESEIKNIGKYQKDCESNEVLSSGGGHKKS